MLAQDGRPGQGEILRAEQGYGQRGGLQAIIDALAVEGVDAGRGITNDHPIDAGHVRHRAAHGQ